MQRYMWLMALGLTLLAACGGPPPPDLALQGVSPPGPALYPGQTLTLTLTLSSQNGFQGQVGLAVLKEGQPVPWLTLSPTQKTLNIPKGGQVQETLQVSLAPEAPVGVHSLRVRVSYGSKTAEADLALTVQARDFSLEANPTGLTLAQGARGSVSLALNRQGVTEPIALSLEGQAPLATTPAPDRIAWSFDPNPAPGNGATLTLTVGAQVPPGNYALTVRGQAGSLSRSRTLTLQVEASGGGGGGPTGSYALTLSVNALTLAPGETGQVSVGLQRQGFTGPVTLSLEGSNLLATAPAPDRIAWSFSPNPATGASASLTLAVGTQVPPGSYTLTLRGQAQGLPDQTASLTLQVQAGGGGGGQTGSYTLQLSTGTLQVAPGAQGTLTVNLNRQNFTGAVSLALEGSNLLATSPAPDKIAWSFNPNPVTGNNSTLTLTVGAQVPSDTYTLTVRGQAQGLQDQTATFNLTVLSSSGTVNTPGGQVQVSLQGGVLLQGPSPVPVNAPGHQTPYGGIAFTAQVPQPGGTLTVTLTFPQAIPSNAALFKCTGQVCNYLQGAQLSGTTATFQIQDGGALDADGQANGQVVDPVALGVPMEAQREGWVTDISADGRTVVGYTWAPSGGPHRPTVWIIDPSVQDTFLLLEIGDPRVQVLDLPVPPGHQGDAAALGVSPDGTCVAGYSRIASGSGVTAALRWDLTGTSASMAVLPSPYSAGNIAYDCLRQGQDRVVVGRVYPDEPYATRWINNTLVDQTRWGGSYAILHRIGANGQISGQIDRRAILWDGASADPQRLNLPSGAYESVLSPDGSAAGFFSNDGMYGDDRRPTRVVKGSAVAPVDGLVYALWANGDEVYAYGELSNIQRVGRFRINFGSNPPQVSPFEDLENQLKQMGLLPHYVTLLGVRGISADGRILACQAYWRGRTVPCLLRLPN